MSEPSDHLHDIHVASSRVLASALGGLWDKGVEHATVPMVEMNRLHVAVKHLEEHLAEEGDTRED